MQEKKLKELLKKAINDLSEINITVGEIISIETMKRQKWGECSKIANNKYKIRINENLLKEGKKKGALKVITHELIHTLPNCMNHGMDWKFYSKVVNRNLNYNIKRTTSCEELKIDIKDFMQVNYILKCKDCGTELYRTRKSKLIREYHNYKCSKCKGDFERIK